MIGAIASSLSTLQASSRVLENSANNLANINTTGFKRSQVSLSEVGPGAGVAVGAVRRDVSQGPLIQTGNAFDLAIQGEGFIQVRQPNGEAAFTRDGALAVDANGQLVTSTGLPLEPPIQLPAGANNFSIASDGTVTSILQDGTAADVGQMNLVRFPNPGGLRAEGNNLLTATAASGAPTPGIPGQGGLGTLHQESLEGSNTDIVSDLTTLVVAQRSFEIGTRVFRVGDSVLEATVDLVA